jgi:hypothetical protein
MWEILQRYVTLSVSRLQDVDVVQKDNMVLNCVVLINIEASYFEMDVLLAVWSPT